MTFKSKKSSSKCSILKVWLGLTETVIIILLTFKQNKKDNHEKEPLLQKYSWLDVCSLKLD